MQGDKVVADTAGTPNPASTPYVFTMCANADGTQWYGTSDGLYFSRADAPAALIKEPAIAFPVTSIFDDGLGFLWLAGRTPGVVRFRIWDRQIFPYTTAEGLGDDEITRALCDRDGNLWASTPNGIFRVSRNDLDGVADGQRRRFNLPPSARAMGCARLSAPFRSSSRPAVWQRMVGSGS